MNGTMLSLNKKMCCKRLVCFKNSDHIVRYFIAGRIIYVTGKTTISMGFLIHLSPGHAHMLPRSNQRDYSFQVCFVVHYHQIACGLATHRKWIVVSIAYFSPSPQAYGAKIGYNFVPRLGSIELWICIMFRVQSEISRHWIMEYYS